MVVLRMVEVKVGCFFGGEGSWVFWEIGWVTDRASILLTSDRVTDRIFTLFLNKLSDSADSCFQLTYYGFGCRDLLTVLIGLLIT